MPSRYWRYMLGMMIYHCLTPVFANDFNVSGYVDTSYNYLLRKNSFTSGVLNRQNDREENGFTLNQVALTTSYTPTQGLGGLIDVIVGHDTYMFTPAGWNPYFGSQTLGMVYPNAYLQYAVGSFTFYGGVINALAGFENYDPSGNIDYSWSILAIAAEPGVMMGVRSIYRATDKLSMNMGLNNGWNGFKDTSRRKTVELGAAYEITAKLSVMLQGLSGAERLSSTLTTGPTGVRNYLNVIGVYKMTSTLTFVATSDYGVQSKALIANNQIGQALWQGVTGYVNYHVTEKWRVAGRGEIYDDQNGYTTGVRQNWRETTLTVGYAPIKNMEIRAETRHDFSNVSAFIDKSGRGHSNNQQSYALEAYYTF